jgi:hypothetical protein
MARYLLLILMAVASLVAVTLASCCGPNVFIALHNANFVAAPFQYQGAEIVPASSSYGVVIRDGMNSRLAFNDTALYPDPKNNGVLTEQSAYLIGLFAEGRFAIILNSTECLQTSFNSSDAPFPSDCFSTFVGSVLVAGQKLPVALQEMSDPGHLTIRRFATVTSDPVCEIVQNRIEFLNGNLNTVGVLSQSIWNMTALTAAPESAFVIPALCQTVPPSHPTFAQHWMSHLLRLRA